MRFAILPLVCLIGSAITAPTEIVRRDKRVAERVINDVNRSLRELFSAVNAFGIDPRADMVRQEQDIELRAQALTDSLKRGANDFRKGPVIELAEAIVLRGQVEGMMSNTQLTVRAWIAAKPTIVRSGGRDAVLRILAQQERAAEELANAMASRIPEPGKTFGKLYGTRVRAVIQQAITEFRKN